jgi:hypothetical protein
LPVRSYAVFPIAAETSRSSSMGLLPPRGALR